MWFTPLKSFGTCHYMSTTHLSQKDANQKRNVKDLGVLCMYTWAKKTLEHE
jgi:hypothetical protein